MSNKRADELVEGDRVDLEGDPFFAGAGSDPGDQEDHQSCVMAAESEYAIVASIERETPKCIRVDFDNFCSCGFPPDHLLKIGD